MKKPPFVNDQIYHIVNRGVEKRNIFMDDNDYLRFLYNLVVFNSTHTPDRNVDRDIKKQDILNKLMSNVSPFSENGELLVEILVFELMPNHFHLMVRQLVDGGIIKFMQKLGTGYTMYFNIKYERVGALFQGRFKAVLVEKDAHFLYLPYYIHTNSIDLISVQGSTSNRLNGWGEKMKFLENYKWSSFPDYIGKKNFPAVTQRDFLMETFGGENGHRKGMREWLKEENEYTGDIKSISLDY